MGITKISGMEQAHESQAALKVGNWDEIPGWDAAKNQDEKRVLIEGHGHARSLSLERLVWSGSLCERVVSGSALDSAGGSDAIQTCPRSSAFVSLGPHVHLTAVASHGCRAMPTVRIQAERPLTSTCYV